MSRRSKRTRAIFVRVSEREHAIIEDAARRVGLSLPTYLRTQALRDAERTDEHDD